jgi:hypothetical protein
MNLSSNEKILSVLIILAVLYLIYHSSKCHSRRQHYSYNSEPFIDMTEYTELTNSINHINAQHKHDYSYPKITSCGY